MEDGSEQEGVPTGAEYRLGAKLYLFAGLGAAGFQFLAPAGPWRWVMNSVAVVCLVRSGWYMYRAKKL